MFDLPVATRRLQDINRKGERSQDQGMQHRGSCERVRVVEVPDLGEEAVIVEGEPTLLLLDGGLSCDRRMAIMEQVMDELSEPA